VTPYIILESLNSEKNSSRTIHTVVIKSEKREFQMGRGHDSDLRINDISVSRRHASLEYRDDGFYVVDFQSKFGTLVLLSDNVTVPEATHTTLQIGRTVVTMKCKMKSKVPEFKTNNSRMEKVKTASYNESEVALENGLKIIEIDGKRFLVRPEVDEDPINNEEGELDLEEAEDANEDDEMH
jgi:pSer/pThr/pTyr-binding forkhead associated (FHA) protein